MDMNKIDLKNNIKHINVLKFHNKHKMHNSKLIEKHILYPAVFMHVFQMTKADRINTLKHCYTWKNNENMQTVLTMETNFA